MKLWHSRAFRYAHNDNPDIVRLSRCDGHRIHLLSLDCSHVNKKHIAGEADGNVCRYLVTNQSTDFDQTVVVDEKSVFIIHHEGCMNVFIKLHVSSSNSC